ncbi:hypothetical protein Esi_0061_0110 [Ectocarpus siliculosus]|uniref:Uncharacterized protein n=1 Tax=Ectocarpus siliculosus TaxID=2880 RepID=D8LR08_ECTSI|nr:hypothetical protein Esi_0061_0110 [Ectocarpus siliculosus]|eukprot:CBN77681.1 hypothetical protein Esi_0061_0110 [Ectocarpus siliculosus]
MLWRFMAIQIPLTHKDHMGDSPHKFPSLALDGHLVASRRRHVAVRGQYHRSPFGDEPEVAALGDFNDRVVVWVEAHGSRSGHLDGGRNSSPLPALPWSLSVEILGIRDGTRDSGPTSTRFAADRAAPNDDVLLPPHCANRDAPLQQVLYLVDLQSPTTPPSSFRCPCFILTSLG